MVNKTSSKKFVSSFLKIGLLAIIAIVVIIPSTTQAAVLYRELGVGSTGSDVSSLQTFLAQDVTLYPQGLVTGYFGFLTKSAVSNFQSRNGIPAVGRVGPMTLPVINSQMSGGMGNNGNNPGPSSIIYNLGVNTYRNNVTVNWNTNDLAKGVVYYSTSPLVTAEHVNSVDVSGNTAMTDSNLRTSQSVSISNLDANTTYYYMVYTTNQAGNVSVTWPSTFRTTN